MRKSIARATVARSRKGKAEKRLPCRDLSGHSAIYAPGFSGALSSGRAAAQAAPTRRSQMFVRRTLAALAIGAVLAGETATAASAGVPEGMTKAAYRALHIRSEALNNLYGNAVTRLSPAQFAAYWNAGASRLSSDEFNALVVRSEGLNSYGKTLQASTPVASTSASTSFAWDDFGIGMAAAFGLVLLTGGLAVAVRTGTRKQVRIPS